MMTLLQDSSKPESTAVKGLIFDTASPMTAESTYSTPPIMSEASPTDSSNLKPYCYNQLDFPQKKEYTTTYQHFFHENCYVLDAIVPTFYTFAGLWTLLAILPAAHLFLVVPAESRLSMQKSLLLFPTLKALELLLQGVWLGYCPWVDMTNSAYQYI